MPAPDKATRDANLDLLASTAKTYLKRERERLDSETRFLRSVLKGRGAESAAALNLAEGKDLVVARIDEFFGVTS